MSKRSVLKYSTSLSKITESDVLLFLGSCFSNNIGDLYKEQFGKAIVQPMQTMYNPLSIAYWLQEPCIFPTDLIKNGDKRFAHFQAHTRLKGDTKEEALATIKAAQKQLHQGLQKATTVFITFGTATVYKHLKGNETVGNCHKLPITQFEKTRLTSSEIVEEWAATLRYLKVNFPNLKQVCFTVSPVRYIKDGLIENNRSKAVLHLAVEELCRTFDYVHYYPAFELVQDELRDYEFYNHDFAHPNEKAVQYVWKHFLENCVEV